MGQGLRFWGRRHGRISGGLFNQTVLAVSFCGLVCPKTTINPKRRRVCCVAFKAEELLGSNLHRGESHSFGGRRTDANLER